MSFLSKWFGSGQQAYLISLQPLVQAINKWEEPFRALADQEFPGLTTAFRQRLAKGETLDDLLPEAFAAGREAARRTLNERPYDVQILGGIILHQGKIAEMKTGEGKTLVTILPAYLNALAGQGVHVVTVNDYLSRRDAVWMGQVYSSLGLTVGVINGNASYLYDPHHPAADPERDATGSYRVAYQFLKKVSRREAYAADITYGTNNEFGFDYLRDHIAGSPSEVVERRQNEHLIQHYAIIDEVDSALIDEARTPLIISAPVAEADSRYRRFVMVANTLEPIKDYTVDEKHKAVALTEAGIARAEKLLGLENLYTEGALRDVHHLETAVRAKALYLCDRDYVVKDGEIVIVDTFTGRLQPGRRWSDGLHQAIEAKEKVSVKQESRTFASITLQNFFKLYAKKAGMTGTALTSAEEFRSVYGLTVVPVPPHRPSARQDETDLIFRTEAGKFQALARRVKELQLTGQPVLIGTVSIEKSELVAEHFRRAGIKHQILNAKNHEAEGAIIAEAGRLGSVVIATNMAGRGVDIKLGGPQATPEEYQAVKNLGGLFVIGTERHEARRIDNQLRGRSGRQGDPGHTQFYISFEDTLARVFAAEKIKNMMARLGLREDEAIENRLVARAIESAQTKIEGLNFDARKHLLDYDNVLNHQRSTIYDRRRSILFDESGRAALAYLTRVTAPLPNAAEIIALASAHLLALRALCLQAIDNSWVGHLETMEYLRGSVSLRGYGQRDPLVEYKREGLRLFRELEAEVADTVIRVLPTLTSASISPPPVLPTPAMSFSETKIGRNDPCPCGSGKKYKKCHGR